MKGDKRLLMFRYIARVLKLFTLKIQNMIKNKKDYIDYILADKEANHVKGKFAMFNMVWKYIKCMRKIEYIENCKCGTLYMIWRKWLKYKLYRLSISTGITIPPHTFGKGLYIPHYGSIVVNASARFGDYCVIQNGINISEGVKGGNHIYIGTGAKLMMNVKIADDVIIGANAVLTKDVCTPNIVVGGIPAKIISSKGFRERIKV